MSETLINNILSMQKIKGGKMELTFALFISIIGSIVKIFTALSGSVIITKKKAADR